ncbi:nucleoside triphosphate pyrophosphohydrolase ham1 [Puccinia graminis f. sp. tritici]|uniref:Nucleoside triphosphate pyrophosphohydrolase ham1 n=1 Tax=Puccinia graminis f. sp. tritici TaxID=56615 RepID=A0A5B0SFK2_PUCGR|nr:nucleoside triphosphate pyrophosphohydrolase ham1 [Puccinia graminis f. sp. tritici]
MLQGFSSTEATALCTFAYCEPGKEPILFEGATEGNIVPARGPTNFGWDPIVEVSGTGMTYAEMPAEQKKQPLLIVRKLWTNFANTFRGGDSQ